MVHASVVRVTVLERPASYAQPTRMLAEIDARIAAGPATDLVVVPEAALHGYVSPEGDFDLTRLAEPIDGPTATACAALAKARSVHLVSSLVLREGAALYNAMTCFGPDGALAFVYRKRHPWFPERWATPGPQRPPLIEIGGTLVTIAVCYDLHFLDRDAVPELEAADLLLFPSAWVEQVDTRAAHLAEVAQRFTLHIANANWAAGVVHVAGQGGSCTISPTGVITRAVNGRADVVV